MFATREFIKALRKACSTYRSGVTFERIGRVLNVIIKFKAGDHTETRSEFNFPNTFYSPDGVDENRDDFCVYVDNDAPLKALAVILKPDDHLQFSYRGHLKPYSIEDHDEKTLLVSLVRAVKSRVSGNTSQRTLFCDLPLKTEWTTKQPTTY